MKALIPVEVIEQRILLIRGQRVMLDADLAGLYGTTTKRLNEQVKRNPERFPEDFMFQLTKEEADSWLRSRSQIAMSNAQSNRSQFATASKIILRYQFGTSN